MTKRPDPTASYNSHFISGNHEGIISRDVWKKAQTMIANANEEHAMGVHRTGSKQHFLYGRVFCADCGAPYVRRTLQSHDGSYYKAWNCRERQKGRKGNGCKNRIVKEEELLRCIAEENVDAKLDEGVFRNEMIRVMVSRDGICLRTKETV